MLTVAVLISGTGSNLRALLEAAASADFPARIVVVGADREADGFAHAEAYGIPTFLVAYEHFDSRAQWGSELLEQLAVWNPDLVVLSGLMRVLPPAVVEAWSPRLINTHPAYLPEFPGAYGVRDALAAGATSTGATVHIVDTGVDTGPILARERVAVLPGDDERRLHDRIKPVERRLLIDVVRRIATGDLDLDASVVPTTAAASDAPGRDAASVPSAPRRDEASAPDRT